MSNIVIALTGLPGCGKDTFAHELTHTMQWGKVSFAAPLKRGLSTMLDIPMEDIEHPTIKNEPDYKFGRSIRYMLQTIGTEWGRELIADDIWIQLAKESIQHHFSYGRNVVITDCRFQNEADMVKSIGGYIIQIVRFGSEDAANAVGVSNHASNGGISLDSIDRTLYNNSTLEKFKIMTSATTNELIMNHK